MVDEALAAAGRLAAEGIEAEVIDPRTLVPLDLETIADSVRRTGRAVIAHEAVTAGGFGAEIAAQVQDAAFDCLEAPIQRVGAPFTPVPVSPPLEDAYRPGAEQIYAAARVAIEWDRRAVAQRAVSSRSARPSTCRSCSSGSASSDAPGIRSSTSRWRSTISRFVSASRACSRASASARAPWRRSIASISPT